ncbi:MAG: alpha/beta hydrolase [Phycisphaerae bacterium]
MVVSVDLNVWCKVNRKFNKCGFWMAAVTCAVTTGGLSAKPAAAPLDPFTHLIRIKRDIPYVIDGSPAQTGDLYIPRSLGNHPAVLLIHGGAWKWGSRNDTGVSYLAIRLAANGYEVFNINYRLVGSGGRFPGDLIDCKNALAWLFIHSHRLHIRPSEIFVAGCSAGAHLALMTAYTAQSKYFIPTAYPNEHVKVRAAIGFYTPTNLMLIHGLSRKTWAYKWVQDYLKNWLKLHPIDGMLTASPIAYLRYAVPTLLFQGTRDKLVPPIEASTLAGALKDAHKPVKLIMVNGVGHAFMNFPSPQRRDALNQLLAYLKSRLKRPSGRK